MLSCAEMQIELTFIDLLAYSVERNGGSVARGAFKDTNVQKLGSVITCGPQLICQLPKCNLFHGKTPLKSLISFFNFAKLIVRGQLCGWPGYELYIWASA